MTIYAGATIEVSTGTTWAGRRLLADDVTAVNFRVIGPLVDGHGPVASGPTAMAWDDARQVFTGRYDTDPDIPGEYAAEVVYDAADGATLIGADTFVVEARLEEVP